MLLTGAGGANGGRAVHIESTLKALSVSEPNTIRHSAFGIRGGGGGHLDVLWLFKLPRQSLAIMSSLSYAGDGSGNLHCHSFRSAGLQTERLLPGMPAY
jgi:hypothetical protein